MSRRSLILATAMLAVGALAVPAVASNPSADAIYRITITNTTSGQWFTPPAVATHGRGFDLFDVGSSATVAVQQIAENGNLDAALGAFAASNHVQDSLVALPDPAGPVTPGGAVTFEITASPRARLSFASMLICTNDGFTGLDGMRLPRGKGHTVTADLVAYDAGTEINTQAWEDLVPPCAMLSLGEDLGGTGLTNPELAENGIISMHDGITDAGDLDPDVHGFTSPVGTIEITRVG